MKAAPLLVLGVLSGALMLYLFLTVDPPRTSAMADASVVRADVTRERPVSAAAPSDELPPVQVAAPADVPGGPDTAGRRTLDGTLEDRFGAPIAGERVFLVDENGEHPPANATLTDYVTALSSKAGKFSLSLPGDGPWRLAVGPPGNPRVPISEPRRVTEATRAEVIVPGSAVLRIRFDELPIGEEPIRLEILSLREPREAGERRGRGRNRADRGNQGADRTRNRGRQRDGETDGGGARRRGRGTGDDAGQGGGSRQSALDVRTVLPAAAAVDVVASVAQEAEQDRPAEDRRRQGRRGQDRGADAAAGRGESSADGDAVQGPPPEQWRALRRLELTPEQRESRVVTLESFPVGPVCRLSLFQGDRSFEGVARFTLQEDAVLDVRVFPIVAGPSSSLSYTTSLQFLASDERPAGAHWRD